MPGVKRSREPSVDATENLHLIGPNTAQNERLKAMRDLVHAVDADPALLDSQQLQVAMQRIRDISVSVRGIAISLISRKLNRDPDAIGQYYNELIHRLNDSSVSVVKQVIRLFRNFMDAFPNHEKRADVAYRILTCINKEENVQKLVVDTLMAFFFKFSSLDPTGAGQSTRLLMYVVNRASATSQISYVESFIAIAFKPDFLQSHWENNVHEVIKLIVADAASVPDSPADQYVASDSCQGQGQGQLCALLVLDAVSKANSHLMAAYALSLVPLIVAESPSPDSIRASSLAIDVLTKTAPIVRFQAKPTLPALINSLCLKVGHSDPAVSLSAVKCLGAYCRRWPSFLPTAFNTFVEFFNYAWEAKNRIEQDQGVELFLNSSFLVQTIRCIGSMFRYIDFDCSFLSRDGGGVASADSASSDPTENIFQLIYTFCETTCVDVNLAALGALGNLCMKCAALVERSEVVELYRSILDSTLDSKVALKTQVLRNLALFLLEAGKQIFQAGTDESANLSHDFSENISSSLFMQLSSSLVEHFWSSFRICYFSPHEKLRMAVSALLSVAVQQKVVAPFNAVSMISAMATDAHAWIATNAVPLLRASEARRAGIVAGTLHSGLLYSLELHRALTDFPRGLRPTSALPAGEMPKRALLTTAVLQPVYEVLHASKVQRNAFLDVLLNTAQDGVLGSRILDVADTVFVFDNVASLIYPTVDDVLAVLNVCNRVMVSTGLSVIYDFKYLLKTSEMEYVAEEEEFKPENLYDRLPDEAGPCRAFLRKNCRSLLCFDVIIFLKELYKLTDSKLSEYHREPAKCGAKPALRHDIQAFCPQLALMELSQSAHNGLSEEFRRTMCQRVSDFRIALYSMGSQGSQAVRVTSTPKKKRGRPKRQKTEFTA